ncbi:Putative 3TM holin, Phage_holin_3 [Pseudomonas peli]|uniref:3TM holin, Phage_holin_3 n=1 Tax=Pseudomonas peli TaxID=592361 RepID=A0AB37Z419_9PSED|nr:phage holin family protein [Pseudomonas peli]NMZ68860.1 phage holin family protein [Pseudomonas peli]SCW38849.1 Putative 3TM holin, Phage_holin_3 [Pseudomonas peli]
MVDPWTLLAAAMCGAICLRIVSYRRGDARYRPGVSLLAYALAVGTGCYALSVCLAVFGRQPLPAISPFLLIVLGAVLMLVYRARGNVARIIQLDWTDRRAGRRV